MSAQDARGPEDYDSAAPRFTRIMPLTYNA